MFRLKGRVQQLSLVFTLLLFASSCGILGSDSESGNVTVKMHDAPALYQEVHVDIEEVQVRSEGESWTTISSGPTRVDVTTLINGKFATLAETDLEAGTYNQVRLIFGADNTLKLSGQNYNLKLSGSVEEGVVMNINLNVDAESSATLLMDFKLQKSIVRAALNMDAQFVLNPVIEVKNAEQTGSIAGQVDPERAKPWIYAIHNSDTVTSTIADTTSGEFELNGLKENYYNVYIEPTDDMYSDTTIAEVEVEARKTNNIGQIELSIADTTKQDPIR